MRLISRPFFSSAVLVGLLSVVLTACGSDPKPPGEPDAGGGGVPSYSVGGTMSGLRDGAQVVLRNGEESLSVTTNGSFAFSQKVARGAAYAVTVQSPPEGASCTVESGSGTMDNADVTSVAVTCGANTYPVGGVVSGLSEGASLELRNNDGPVLTVSANGPFRFPAEVVDLAGYSVTVQSSPAGHACTVERGAGTVNGSAVTDVAITCAAHTFGVRGSLFGLTQGQSVVLKNNGGDAITITASGQFVFATPVAFGASYDVTVEAVYPVACTVSRGTGTMGNQPVTNVSVSCKTTRFSLGGTVTGLLPTSSVELTNGSESIRVNVDGSFVFVGPVDDLSGYSVTVSSPPMGQACDVRNGTGTVSGANVNSVVVICWASEYPLGGSVAGLSGGQSVVLKNNGGDALTVASNGSFTFPKPVSYWSTYVVTAEARYPLICSVPNGTGRIGVGGNADVVVSCTTRSFTVGGEVAGLVEGTALELWNNEQERLTVSANGPFAFLQPAADLSAYSVSVKTQPEGQSCEVRQGTGTLGGATVKSVSVVCSPNSYLVRGTVAGLGDGQSAVLRNNGGDDLTVSADGAFAFPTPVAFGAAYSVTAQATAPLVCTVSNGTGTMGEGDVTRIEVLCGTASYPVGGSVSGLAEGAMLELQNNGDEVLPVSANGAFTFAQQVAEQGSYSVTVKTQPENQRCAVSSGGGTVSGAPVTNIVVTCENVYRLRVSVSGLTGTLGLKSGADALTVATGGESSFPLPLRPGEAYAVEVSRHPMGQTCEVSGGTGAMGEAHVTVMVACEANAMVFRVGAGATALNSNATEVFVDEYRPMGGAPVRTFAIPSSNAAGAARLTVTGGDVHQGHLSRSGNGRLLTFTGFDADVGLANVSATTASETPRVIGQLDLAGTFTLPVRLSDAYDRDQVRAASTVDGTGYWLSGRGGGIRHALPAENTTVSTAISTGVADTRFVSLFDGRVYFSLGTAPNPNPQGYNQGILTFPTEQPTAAVAPNQLPSLSTVFNSSGFALLDERPEVAGVDTAYVSINLGRGVGQGETPDMLRLEKWTFDGVSWSRVSSFVPTFAVAGTTIVPIATHGVSAVRTPRGVRVYVTTYQPSGGGAGNLLVSFLDDGSSFTPSVHVVATAPANTSFRGVSASPLP
ncbi:hypothetical protein [Myxococcus xanthus]|uniref:hypothetical protein n=1 Tax=Myxococcus xanthus TaxID=34 RepID=UPI001F3928C2|nr:hypothetical protein [Myxococcus xanthus]